MNKLNEESAGSKFLFWVVYVLAGLVAAYHSATVFLMSDPWYVAVPAAVVIDGLTMYSTARLGQWRNNQRGAGVIGILLFAFISASAQVIARFHGSGVDVPVALRFISLALVPLSSTGAVLALGAIHYFGSGKANVSVAQSGEEPTESDNTPVLPEPKIEEVRLPVKALPAAPAYTGKKRGRKSNADKLKIAYAKDVEADPKLKNGS